MKFKKIILLFLFSFFLIFPSANAKQITSVWNPFSQNTWLFSNSQSNIHLVSNSRHWANWGYGHLTFNFTMFKTSGQSLEPVMLPLNVNVNNYNCNYNTASTSNSTWTGTTFSVTCPMMMEQNGLQDLYIFFEGDTTDTNSQYRLTLGGMFTFESFSEVDLSSTNSAIQGTTSAVNNNTNAVNSMNNNIMNDDVSSSTNTASGFFDDFTQNSHGLSGIVTSPLRLLNALSTAECNPLEFNLPFVHNTVSLQCMRPIYENYFGVFFTLFQLITTGMISYHVLLNFYKKVRDLQNPNNDRIEVLDL